MKTVTMTRRILAPAACRAKQNVLAVPVDVVGQQERRAVNEASVIVSRQTEPAIGTPPMYAVAPVWYSPQTRQREALTARGD